MTSISRRIMFEVVDQLSSTGSPLRVAVVMTSTPRDPQAITLFFKTQPPKTWPVARDLLIDGLVRPTGVGDIRVAPDPSNPDWTLVTLSPPDGHAVLRVRRRTLISFLVDTSSHVDIINEIDEWLRKVA